ncbi:unnamed protein product [Lasius platythorax]|uniref:Uncharacterized protein n=1 Tax=Lasius platythorax TaxID=488582 RepID=A0AAV2N692_9HYME
MTPSVHTRVVKNKRTKRTRFGLAVRKWILGQMLFFITSIFTDYTFCAIKHASEMIGKLSEWYAKRALHPPNSRSLDDPSSLLVYGRRRTETLFWGMSLYRASRQRVYVYVAVDSREVDVTNCFPELLTRCPCCDLLEGQGKALAR